MICNDNGFINRLASISGIDTDSLIECIMSILSIRYFDCKESQNELTITIGGTDLFTFSGLYVTANPEAVISSLPPFSLLEFLSMFRNQSISIHEFVIKSDDFIDAAYRIAKDIEKWKTK